VEEVTTEPAVFSDPDVDMICVFDAGDLKYAGIDEFVEGMGERPYIANFDHHVTNDFFGDENLVIIGASSTAEVVHGFFRTNGESPTREMSVCLMTGLLTDTSNFSNPATTVGSLEAASDLLLRGADINDITRRLMKDKPLMALKVWGLALERLKWHPDEKLATTALFRKDFEEHEVDDEHLEGLSNFLNHLLTAEVVLVLKETTNGRVKGSYRSANDIDVAEMAKQYGGGGHKKAAGFAVEGEIIESDSRWEIRLKEEKIEADQLR
jgi:phosphoesterase RecJ-like protein